MLKVNSLMVLAAVPIEFPAKRVRQLELAEIIATIRFCQYREVDVLPLTRGEAV